MLCSSLTSWPIFKETVYKSGPGSDPCITPQVKCEALPECTVAFNRYSQFFYQLILMYLSILIRNLTDDKLHLVSIFKNAHQVEVVISWILNQGPLVVVNR